jgi:hypothetical protein
MPALFPSLPGDPSTETGFQIKDLPRLPDASHSRTIAITSIEKARQLKLSAHYSQYFKSSRAAEKGPPRMHDAEV